MQMLVKAKIKVILVRYYVRRYHNLLVTLSSIAHTTHLVPLIFCPTSDIYIYIYIYIFRFRSQKRNKYFKVRRSTKRFIFFQRFFLFRSFIHVCFQLVPFFKHKWIQISLRNPFARLCAVYVLWRKQQAGNIHICKNKTNKENFLKIQIFSWTYSLKKKYMYIYSHIFNQYIYIYIERESTLKCIENEVEQFLYSDF